jgi:hypothetical protein
MTRINVYTDIDEYGADTGELAGWFNTDSAEQFNQDTEWDGSNLIGVITKSQWVYEYLYRTKGGRWVLNHDEHRYRNGPDTYRFINDDEARDWLLRSQCNDEAVKRFFGEVEEESGPGRPEIGGAVHVRLGDLLGRVDLYARESKYSRAEAIRELVLAGLIHTYGH